MQPNLYFCLRRGFIKKNYFSWKSLSIFSLTEYYTNTSNFFNIVFWYGTELFQRWPLYFFNLDKTLHFCRSFQFWKQEKVAACQIFWIVALSRWKSQKSFLHKSGCFFRIASGKRRITFWANMDPRWCYTTAPKRCS